MIPQKTTDVKGKNIIQVSLDGEKLNTYESITAAAKAVGIDRKGVRSVLNGEQKTAGGYYWLVENNKLD